MTKYRVPSKVLARFHELTMERLSKLEAHWEGMVSGDPDPERRAELHRLIHTVKGDARVVGFDEAHAVAAKLEELLHVVQRNGYHPSHDVEIAVMMGFRFLAMLVARRPGQELGGVDLDGFLSHIDAVIGDERTALEELPAPSRPSLIARQLGGSRLSSPARASLACAATRVFLEHAVAPWPARDRLLGVWRDLGRQLADLDEVSLRDQVQKHEAAAARVASERGKLVRVEVEVGALRLSPGLMDAVDVALVHALRNAIAHGIEEPAVRRAAGKSEEGLISIAAEIRDRDVVLTIADDGQGIDLPRVRAEAERRRLIEPGAAPSEDELVELLFRPGFTTRGRDDLAGHGIGLDAVRTEVERLGARVHIERRPDAGAALVVTLPRAARKLPVTAFVAVSTDLWLAVAAPWRATACEPSADDVDPLERLGVAPRPKELAPAAVALALGAVSIRVRAATPPWGSHADRLCPTPDDFPIEVVAIDGKEALLLRPDRL